MRSGFAFIVLTVAVISALTLVFTGGGKGIYMRHNDTEASIGLPRADTNVAGTFETATFALG